ncbi:MAG: DUF4391 domain-containing protein [Deltaproteobacteria bacterium]|nr:DUF4391 domain-containing protein [Deltaproteobacteria bacterium]
MIEALYEKMMIPQSCRLDKRVYKKLFHENAKLSATDKKALRDHVDTILWQYTFKPTTIPIQPYEDDQGEYHEVALLQVNLTYDKRVNRLCEIIHRAIPYPLILVFHISNYQSTIKNQKCLISLAYKRFSQAEKAAIVAEGFQATGWLDLSNPTENQAAFLASLDISTWPHTHFFAFYRAAMDRVIALACAEHSGHYSLEIPNGLSVDDRVNKLKQVEKLQQKKSEIQGKLKKEKNLGTQVQLNTRIKQIRDRIEAIKSEL